MLSWFEAAVLGLVQGLTEFLPISSSAHLRVVAELPAGTDPGRGVHRGHPARHRGRRAASTSATTSCAIVRTWTLSLFKPELRGELDARMGWYVIVGTLPIGVLGFVFQDTIEETFRNLWLIAIDARGLRHRARRRSTPTARNARPLERLTLRDAVALRRARRRSRWSPASRGPAARSAPAC